MTDETTAVSTPTYSTLFSTHMQTRPFSSPLGDQPNTTIGVNTDRHTHASPDFYLYQAITEAYYLASNISETVTNNDLLI
jgi:hypothetical protein